MKFKHSHLGYGVWGIILVLTTVAFADTSSVVEQYFSFSIKTANVDSVFQKAIQAAEAKGGYFTNYNSYSLSLRLPVSELQEFQKTIESLTEIINKDFSSSDKTAELEKLNMQIQSRKKLMDTYLGLVKNAPFSELQSVEREMVSLNAQIENLQGRKLAIEKKAELASITINASEMVVPVARNSSYNSPFLWINSTNLSSLRGDF
jgi:Zn-dependent oligopeptidase